MPKKSQMPSQIPEIQPLTESQSHDARPQIPFHKPFTMLPPISTILYISEPKAFTIPSIILGTAFTISLMIVGRFLTSEINKSIPA